MCKTETLLSIKLHYCYSLLQYVLTFTHKQKNSFKNLEKYNSESA